MEKQGQEKRGGARLSDVEAKEEDGLLAGAL